MFVGAGLLGAALLPSDLLSRATYVSENAIQPGQVNTYWGWDQVHLADRYAERIAQWRRLPSRSRADSLQQEFAKIGLTSSIQPFVFDAVSPGRPSITNGTNVYAVLHAPRTDGSEALVLMASWLTRRPGSDVWGGDVNVRGVASVLALAAYLKGFNLWSKDIIFLVADGFLQGTQAWLKSYHGLSQSNLQCEPMDLRTGPIWAALNIDYPFHSFSHIGIEYEGINGQLPNLDFINTVAHIVRWTGTSPVTIHAQALQPALPSYLPHHPALENYYRVGRTIGQQMIRGALGTPSGPEGIFTTYRIDAVGIFAHPADGPHGFYTMGKVVESTLRSLNNLLERFHQSFFLYLLQSENKFISVGVYLFIPLLIGAGLSLRGLEMWAKTVDLVPPESKLDEKSNRIRPYAACPGRIGEILWSLRVIVMTHLMGGALFWGVVRSVEPNTVQKSWPKLGFLLIFQLSPMVIIKLDPPTLYTKSVFEPIRLLLSGCLITVVSVLNFPLGTALGVALSCFGASLAGLLVLVGLVVYWFAQACFDDQVLESWFLPFCCIIVEPLLLQSVLVRVLTWLPGKHA